MPHDPTAHPAHAYPAGSDTPGATATQVMPMPVSFELNGEPVDIAAPPMRRLLDVLREDLGLKGTKEGCGEGECGACTVLLDDMPVNACLVPIAQCDGARIVTVEGIADHGVLHPVQQAFAKHGGAQCGICTPGMVVTAAWAVDHHVPAKLIRRVLAGNICRCTGYQAIVDSVEAAIAAEQAHGGRGGEGGPGPGRQG